MADIMQAEKCCYINWDTPSDVSVFCFTADGSFYSQ